MSPHHPAAFQEAAALGEWARQPSWTQIRDGVCLGGSTDQHFLRHHCLLVDAFTIFPHLRHLTSLVFHSAAVTRPRCKCRFKSAGSWVLILPGVQIIICVLDTFVSSPTRKKNHKKIQRALQEFRVPRCEVRIVDVEDCKKG